MTSKRTDVGKAGTATAGELADALSKMDRDKKVYLTVETSDDTTFESHILFVEEGDHNAWIGT